MKSPYEILNLTQGSLEWIEARYNYITASQVPSLFELNPYQKKEALFEEKIFRKTEEVSEFKQKLFDRAHEVEIKCRQWAEKDLNITIPPMVLISKKCPQLLASLDGFSLEKNIIFEAKYMGTNSLEEVKKGLVKTHHSIQVQAQLYASGANKCIYFALDDKGDAAIIEIFPDKFYHKMIYQHINEFVALIEEARKIELSLQRFGNAT